MPGCVLHFTCTCESARKRSKRDAISQAGKPVEGSAVVGGQVPLDYRHRPFGHRWTRQPSTARSG